MPCARVPLYSAVAESKSVVVFANREHAKADSSTLRDVAALTKQQTSGHLVMEVFQPEMGAAIVVITFPPATRLFRNTSQDLKHILATRD
jgi:hypothetical protein